MGDDDDSILFQYFFFLLLLEMIMATFYFSRIPNRVGYEEKLVKNSNVWI